MLVLHLVVVLTYYAEFDQISRYKYPRIAVFWASQDFVQNFVWILVYFYKVAFQDVFAFSSRLQNATRSQALKKGFKGVWLFCAKKSKFGYGFCLTQFIFVLFGHNKFKYSHLNRLCWPILDVISFCSLCFFVNEIPFWNVWLSQIDVGWHRHRFGNTCLIY